MSLLDVSPVIPVVVLDEVETAVPLAQALLAGGIRIVEVTLRTPAALEGIRRIAAEVPDITLGAGTVTDVPEVEAAVEAGAHFLVSPGTTPDLRAAMLGAGVPAVPGCATVSEVMVLRELGFTELKFFPAEVAGGPEFLKAPHGPLSDLTFCATGGITPERAPAYLALPNVACVGGSWLTPTTAITERAWDRITELASTAAGLTGLVR